tara:strand:- start:242 stop:1441 length:1200 start_codon:yes stop_codon:yes gene_type:complete
MIINGVPAKNIKKRLFNYLTDMGDVFDINEILSIINRELPENNHLTYYNKAKPQSTKVMICTGVGNTIQGGADIWVNNFLKNVWPKLEKRTNWKLLIDSKRPTNFDSSSLPKGLKYHFHYDDTSITEEWLSKCTSIYSLHSHYHKREHIWKWEDKFEMIFIHAYPKEMREVVDSVPELKRLQFNTLVDESFCDDYISTFKERVWIGNNPSTVIEAYPNYTYRVPNFYEFKHNLPLQNECIDNGKLGFASRCESRKCIHWMHGYEGYVLTGKYDFQNLKDTTTYTFPNTKFFQWHPTIHDVFMKKDFGIFHGAYFKEPFGYSIFQSVDYGKIPIIHTGWAEELDYKYRASTKNEFDKAYKKILFDSYEVRLQEFNKIKSYMMQYDYKKGWTSSVIKLLEK